MRVLFVCTGNSCRSPMAEYLSRDAFYKMGLPVEVASGGISVLMALPASDNALEVMKDDYWIDMSEHRTRQIIRDDLAAADLVLCMTDRHKNYLTIQAPDMAHKIYTLGQFIDGSGDIADPFGGGSEEYRACAKQLNGLIQTLATRLKEEQRMKIGLGSDHAGYALKQEIIKHLEKRHTPYKDFGPDSASAVVDYPDYAKKVAQAVLSGECRLGILICGTGIGISIAANRHRGIRAALCHDVFSAKSTRQHNDANILALGGRVIGVGPALEVVEAFLNTRFPGDERHVRRIEMLDVD